MKKRSLDQLFRPGVRASHAYTLVQEKAAVKLNQNESPFDVPDELKEEVFRRLRARPWNRYTQDIPARITKLLADRNDWPVEGVVLGAGSNLLLELLLFAVAGRNDPVLAPVPCFSLYKLISGLAEADFHEVPFEPGFLYNENAWSEAIERINPLLLFICNPNNPTGSFFEAGALERLVDKAPGLAVIDEAYCEFAGESARSFLERHRHLVLVRTFSKAYSGAGLRLGYLLAHPEVSGEVQKIVPPFNINILTATAAEVLLENQELINGRVNTIIAEKELLAGALEEIPGIEVFPTRANFFLMRTSFAAQELSDALAARDVLVRVLSGEALQNMVRVNVGTRRENELFLEAVKELFEKRSGQ